VNRIHISKLAVFALCSLLIISFFVPTIKSSTEPIDENWVAYPQHITPLAGYAAPHGYSPNQIRTAYNLPPSGGTGTTIAIIDAYDTPNILNYYTVFCDTFGLPNNSTGNFKVHKMPGTVGTDTDWAMETCLDVEWARAIAPNAMILLVEAKDNTGTSLFDAIEYATSQPGVVAVSMSWGGDEFYYEYLVDEYYFNAPGIAFFASSGDHAEEVLYPASSVNVVGVGGTTLSLNLDGTVISETGWSGSGGGKSSYEPLPSYQSNYGLTTTKRTVPDVSYNADPSTGVSVYYNGLWYTVGGTSAGAPQWAAIHTLGLSASNVYLYEKAKVAYSSYFRDITSGFNGNYNAIPGYDNVTGLGSPLTFKFDASFEVSPTQGPVGNSISLSGTGFTPSSSVNISYLNPVTSIWIPIIDNYAINAENFTYNLTAPDLFQNNAAGDHSVLQDSIVFRVQDNIDNHAYNTTIPYTEYRRGLTQIGTAIALGVYGNNTNLAASLFVQNSQNITLNGAGFSPGSVELLWDNVTSLGITTSDGAGLFSLSVQVPDTSAGQHTILVRDSTDFCVNLTRMPKVSDNYTATWLTTDTTIYLVADYPVNETFYKINNGTTLNVTTNGQPIITTEGSANLLEYWSTWNVYGIDIAETPHVTLTGIQVDKTAPTGTISTDPIINSPTIILALSATDATSGVDQMRFSNDGINYSNWESYVPTQTWDMIDGDGQKTVSVQYIDNAGLTSTYSVRVTLLTVQTAVMAISTPAATYSPTPTLSPSSTASPSPTATETPTSIPLPSADPLIVPEIPQITIILVILVAITLMALLARKREQSKVVKA
jgi:hypothetical protein